MKKNKIISAIVAVSMLISLLPAQFASAIESREAVDMSTYIHYINSESDMGKKGEDGAVGGYIWELTKNSSNSDFDLYTLIVSAYNTTAGIFANAIEYDSNALDMVKYEEGSYVAYDSYSDASEFITIKKPTSYMTSNTNRLNSKLTASGMIFYNLASLLEVPSQPDANGYYQISQQLATNQNPDDSTVTGSITSADWKTEYGADYTMVGNEYSYTTPTDIKCELFEIKFKANKTTTLTSESIRPYYQPYIRINGACSKGMDTNDQDTFSDEGVYLMGDWAKPQAADQTVTFTVTDGSSAVGGASIAVYNGTEQVTGSPVSTGTDGKAEIALPAYTTYSYTITKSGFGTKSGDVSVQASPVSVPVELTSEQNTPYSAEITVTDADTGGAVEGAQIYVGGVAETGAVTGTDGKATISKTPYTYKITASKTGYSTGTEASLTVTSNEATNKASVQLTPNRAAITVPTITDSTSNESVTDLTVRVEKTTTDTKTAAWNNGYNSLTETGKAACDTIEVPMGNQYTVTVSAAKYDSITYYADVASDGTVTYYSSNSYAAADVISDITAQSYTITKMTDPQYYVGITQNEDKSFTAEVMLNNIAASYGTFGLQYDNSVFKLDNWALNTAAVEQVNVDEALGAEPTVVTGSDYHVFSWSVLDTTSSENTDLPATADGTLIATYTFSLQRGKSVDDVTSNSFSVMPYDKTEKGVGYLTESPDVDNIESARDMLNKLWRYVDADNDPNNLQPMRLSNKKATLSGFYQVFSSGTVDSDMGMYDVITTIKYENFNASYGALKFIVSDKETNIALKDAEITLCDDSESYVDTLTTPITGITDYAVQGDKTFKYKVECKGYWDEPETGLNSVSVSANTTTEEQVRLEKKIYHTPVLKDSQDNAVQNVTLGGDPYAYNSRDYHFTVDPAPGYKITGTPTYEVVVHAGTTNERTYPATPDTNTNTYYINGIANDNTVQIDGDPTYADPTPDNNGFKSDDIVVRMLTGTIEASGETYTVTGTAGNHGSVTYTQVGSETTTESAIGSIPYTITVDGLDPLVTDGTKTGTFTFTADTANGYKVEKVFVNGVQIHQFDNEGMFTYSFGTVDMDNDISVIFWDGVTHSKEAVVTLAVGPNGKADVSVPSTVADITNTRRTFVIEESSFTDGAAKLEFTPTADTDYSVVSVRESGVNEDSATKTDVDNTTYSVTIPAGGAKVVYVAFDNATLFINAYVLKGGSGKIKPIGVLIMNHKYGSMTFDMNVIDNDWTAYSVFVNGTEHKNNTGDITQFTYTVDNIMDDTDVGAKFTEREYNVTGLIDLSQNSNLSGDLGTGAFITCTRQEDGLKSDPFATTITDTNGDAVVRNAVPFTLNLPNGTWDITVSKPGYVNYTITGFTVDGTIGTDIMFGKKADNTIQKITPYIGNTSGNGLSVSLLDAGVVSNGLRSGASTAIKGKADVDDDGEVSATSDMVFIRANYGRRIVKETYEYFLNKSDLTPLPTTAP